RFAAQPFRNPSPDRASAQPLVLEKAEPVQVIVSPNIFAWIEIQFPGVFEPERSPGFGIEMPLDDLSHLRVESLPGGFHLRLHIGACDCTHVFSAFLN